MIVYSFTDHKYPKPPGDIFGKSWPVQYSEGFSYFYKHYYHQSIIFLYDTNCKAWIPLATHTAKFIKFGQVLHAPVRLSCELDSRQQKIFFERMLKFLKSKRIIHRLLQPHPAGISMAVPENCKSVQFGTYITDLSPHLSAQNILDTFDPKYKKAIQHSIKNGARIVFGPLCYNDFYKVYLQTCSRNQLHVDPEKYFDQLRKILGPESTETGVVYDDQKPIGGLFTIYSEYAALCTHAGSNGPSPLYGGMKFLHYEMMKHLQSKGVQQYDLVGVRIGSQDPALEGIFKFKKGFGGTLKEGYLWKTDLQPSPLVLYDWIQRIRNINLHGDIIDKETIYQIQT